MSVIVSGFKALEFTLIKSSNLERNSDGRLSRLIDRADKIEELPLMSKVELSWTILDKIKTEMEMKGK